MWNADKIVYRGEDDFIRAYQGSELVWEKSSSNNKIFYTSTDGQIVTPHHIDGFGSNIISNTYSEGVGVIELDGDVTKIGANAFRNCTSLTSITIPSSVTIIDFESFIDCTGLTSITIPSSVTRIWSRSFYDCSRLSEVIVNAVVPPTLGADVFKYCNANLQIKVPAESLQAYKTADKWSDYADDIIAQ